MGEVWVELKGVVEIVYDLFDSCMIGFCRNSINSIYNLNHVKYASLDIMTYILKNCWISRLPAHV